jgi:hypothetical protein
MPATCGRVLQGDAVFGKPKEARGKARIERLVFDSDYLYHGTYLRVVVDKIVTSILERPE